MHSYIHIYIATYVCSFTELKPPQIFANCFNNGTVIFKWNLSSHQNLSMSYLRKLHIGWLVSGNCTYQNDTAIYILVRSYYILNDITV